MNDEMRARRVRWADLAFDEPLPLVRRQRLIGEQAMLSRFELSANCEVPQHSHENEQFACVLSGRVRFVVEHDDTPEELIVEAGEVLHLPAMVPHGAFALEDSVVLDVFAPPSETTGVDRR